MTDPDAPGSLPKPTNAAPDAPQRNRPRFEDLPIPDDTANLREGPDLHEACVGLLPLIGVWRGAGEAVYPTIDGPFTFGQQIVFSHDGRPFIAYESRSWILGPDGEVVRPAARESGFWRPQPNGELEVLIIHNTGIAEVLYGRARNLTSWEFASDAVLRTGSAKEVAASQRLYGIVEGGDLAYVDERAMMGQTMQPHLSARLSRIAG
ncbi:protein of unknown function [Pseudonocardia thermophila]|jgi:Domain of unknown function (DUF1794).|uniref:Peroxynitrite isomerase n=1 Tax=Pseudonocardia thermophila TaxID=1848 RepID=A0A1M6SC30_PSETH|nr:FABP family protein [Pseudonocardia thermophila]SHK42068.1 protein of unknown function [Pseudonocardia thermophila]